MFRDAIGLVQGRSVRIGIAACGLAMIAVVPASGLPVHNAANGHYYERVDAVDITWDQAKVAAENSSYLGVQGHLATLATAQENDFILQQDANPDPDWGFHWLGGVQPPGSPEPSGGWTWITGEPWVYTRWVSASEPNNLNGNEDVIEWRSPAEYPPGGWNDRNRNNSVGFILGYIVEYDVPLIPTVSQWGLAVMSLVTLGAGTIVFRRRAHGTSGAGVAPILRGDVYVAGFRRAHWPRADAWGSDALRRYDRPGWGDGL